MPRLFKNERERAIGMLAAGQTAQAVSQVMNVHKSTISRLVIRLRVTGSTDDTPRSGRPSALTAGQERFIVRSYCQNPFQSARAVGRQTVNAQGGVTSPQTISRVSQKRDINCASIVIVFHFYC
ncbi:hypothetical protein V1264_013029 [Littorina saxatilis]|uniref:Transposase IS30-like HTH domain-containing protein n=1 Tax=Littorina saxatilis TaxID=31220 RepID=A0AAN9BW64_9CAEN